MVENYHWSRQLINVAVLCCAVLQVGAHGTGATLPTVDEQVVSLKLVTPAKGTLELTAESDPELFYFARCGLGALGVVAEVTLQCVPRHRLLEYTFVTNMKGVQKNHKYCPHFSQSVSLIYPQKAGPD